MAHKNFVVHCKRQPFDVYIGRPSLWGNQFHIGKDGNRAEVIAKYKAWLMAPERADLRLFAQRTLRGKVLGCYCAPLACHGDVLAEVANASDS